MTALQVARLSRAYGLSAPLAGLLTILIYGKGRT